ncbi:hypothetical protein DSM109990_02822 [Sulfitobacter dubius]|uniref:Exonuclease domain-containing protein n=2 Tax=Sulfitobacter dubius TaxID=218673 RepID=A0ABY3ZQP6_9RHOB|nr:hypothetical protein DSM109990_02822 [Sulfitobacter dubius]
MGFREYMTDLVFIDLEASSLSEDSWPIELGICWLDEREKLRTGSKLIKPHPSWPSSAWSDASQKIHRITLAELENADDATDVAKWAFEVLADALLVSDAVDFDQRWLNRLMDTTSSSRSLKLISVQEAARQCFSSDAMSMFFRAYARGHSTHRAADDALRVGQAWRAALRKERRALAKN